MKDRIIVALDTDSPEAALATVKALSGQVGMFKVGMELFPRGGPELVRRIREAGFDVFLDLKFHDIPNTVAGAVRSAAPVACGSSQRPPAPAVLPRRPSWRRVRVGRPDPIAGVRCLGEGEDTLVEQESPGSIPGPTGRSQWMMMCPAKGGGESLRRECGRVWRCAAAGAIGRVGINREIVATEVAAFGGVNESGLGREGSKYGLEEFLGIKYLCIGGI